MNKKRIIVTALAALFMLIFAIACDKKPAITPSVPDYTDDPDQYVVELKVLSAPAKLDYKEDERFDIAGMKLEAKWFDDEIEQVDPGDVEIVPSRPLAVTDTKVTVVFEDNSVEFEIRVTPIKVVSLSLDGLPALKQMSHADFDFTGLVVSAVIEGVDEPVPVQNYKLLLDGTTELPRLGCRIPKGEHTVGVVYKDKTETFTVEIENGYIVEGESFYMPDQTVPSNASNYIKIIRGTYGSESVVAREIVKDGKWGLPISYERTSGHKYLAQTNPTNEYELHLHSDYDAEVKLIVRCASAELVRKTSGWVPIETKTLQLNKVFEAYYGAGFAQSVVIDDSVILPGAVAADQVNGDAELWTEWVNVDLGTMRLAEGDNVIKIKLKDFVKTADGCGGINIDYFKVEFND